MVNSEYSTSILFMSSCHCLIYNYLYSIIQIYITHIFIVIKTYRKLHNEFSIAIIYLGNHNFRFFQSNVQNSMEYSWSKFVNYLERIQVLLNYYK